MKILINVDFNHVVGAEFIEDERSIIFKTQNNEDIKIDLGEILDQEIDLSDVLLVFEGEISLNLNEVSEAYGFQDIITAAGPAAGPTSGGTNYSDVAGDLLDGVDRLGDLDSFYWEPSVSSSEDYLGMSLGDRGVVDTGDPDTPGGGDPDIPGGGDPDTPGGTDIGYIARAVLYYTEDLNGDVTACFYLMDVDGNKISDAGEALSYLGNISEIKSLNGYFNTDIDASNHLGDGVFSLSLSEEGLKVLKAALDAVGGDYSKLSNFYDYITFIDADGNEYSMQVVINSDGNYVPKDADDEKAPDEDLKHEWHTEDGTGKGIRESGDGADEVWFDLMADMKMNTGASDDIVHIKNMVAQVNTQNTLKTGSGDDTVNLYKMEAFSGGENTIELGSGDNFLTTESYVYSVNGSNIIEGGDGINIITINGSVYASDSGYIKIDAGDNSDSVINVNSYIYASDSIVEISGAKSIGIKDYVFATNGSDIKINAGTNHDSLIKVDGYISASGSTVEISGDKLVVNSATYGVYVTADGENNITSDDISISVHSGGLVTAICGVGSGKNIIDGSKINLDVSSANNAVGIYLDGDTSTEISFDKNLDIKISDSNYGFGLRTGIGSSVGTRSLNIDGENTGKMNISVEAYEDAHGIKAEDNAKINIYGLKEMDIQATGEHLGYGILSQNASGEQRGIDLSIKADDITINANTEGFIGTNDEDFSRAYGIAAVNRNITNYVEATNNLFVQAGKLYDKNNPSADHEINTQQAFGVYALNNEGKISNDLKAHEMHIKAYGFDKAQGVVASNAKNKLSAHELEIYAESYDSAIGVYATDSGQNNIYGDKIDITAEGGREAFALKAEGINALNVIAGRGERGLDLTLTAKAGELDPDKINLPDGAELKSYALYATAGGINKILGTEHADIVKIIGDIYADGNSQNIIDTGAGDDHIILKGKIDNPGSLDLDAGEGVDVLTLYFANPEDFDSYLDWLTQLLQSDAHGLEIIQLDESILSDAQASAFHDLIDDYNGRYSDRPLEIIGADDDIQDAIDSYGNSAVESTSLSDDLEDALGDDLILDMDFKADELDDSADSFGKEAPTGFFIYLETNNEIDLARLPGEVQKAQEQDLGKAQGDLRQPEDIEIDKETLVPNAEEQFIHRADLPRENDYDEYADIHHLLETDTF